MTNVATLRKMLEDKNYKGGRAFYDSLTAQHRDLMGQEPAPQKVFLKDQLFLNGFDRVVLGAHGAYLEFDEEDLVMTLNLKQGRHKKYRHYFPIEFPDVKIYYQLKPVSYADYRIGKYYVDFYDVEWG
jgi:hypothetical protein